MELVNRDNHIYLVIRNDDYNEPRLISSFWETNLSPDELPDNPFIETFGKCYLIKNGYKTLNFCVDDLPTFTEFSKLKPPKNKGYVWKNGKWNKQ